MSRAHIHSLSPAVSRIAVIGGGISGLAAIHRLTELIPEAELTLFEATDRLGGVLETVRRDGFLIERSADSFITKLPWAQDLCRRVGLGDQLLPTNEVLRRALVVHNGQLQHVPTGFVLMVPQRLMPVLTSPILSPWGKLRLLCEPLIPRQLSRSPDGTWEDMSVADFVRRRLGNQVYERLVQPLLAGIYTADTERLSMLATMPEFISGLAEHGSLLKAAHIRAASSSTETDPPPEGFMNEDVLCESGARYGSFVAPRDGLGSLVAAIQSKLGNSAIRLRSPVHQLVHDSSGSWRLAFDSQAAAETFDAVVLATPAPQAARISRSVSQRLSEALAAIEYAGSVVVSLGYRRQQIRHALDGFGFVVPSVECRRILAASFSNVKFAGRAPAEAVVMRVFVGGALQPDLTELDDVNLLPVVEAEVQSLLGISGPPILYDIARWPSSMPQYYVGHVARVKEIERLTAEWPGLELAGNAYHGVGIPQCIHSGETAADRIAEWIGSR